MKQLFIIAAAAALTLAGCSKDGGNGQNPDPYGEEGRVTFSISTVVNSASATRAGTENDKVANADELAVLPARGLKVAVFDQSGNFEKSATLTLEAVMKESEPTVVDYYKTPASQAMLLPQGKHFFFVFVNDDTSTPLITVPTQGATITMDEWMQTLVNVAWTESGGIAMSAPGIAKSGEFLMGTLWKEEKVAPAGGINNEEENVQVVELTVGRLSSKVVVTAVEEGAGTMAGDFGSPKFALGTVARTMFHAGVVRQDGNTAASTAPWYTPYGTGRYVNSAKYAASYANASNNGFNSADFVQQTSFVAVAQNEGVYNALYAVENTTQRQNDEEDGYMNALFYGNTTYVQLETVYWPAASETYTVDGTGLGAVRDSRLSEGASFFTGVLNLPDANDIDGDEDTSEILPQTLIFDNDPSDITGISNPTTYTNGKNYHFFPIEDSAEGDAELKYRVLRNHYYEYAVTGILSLGSNTPNAPYDKPIDEETNVRLHVKVANWDKVVPKNVVVGR